MLDGTQEVWVDIPEGNAKTTLMAGFALYHGDHVESASVPIAAASREQTGIPFGQMEGFVRRTRGLEKRFRVYNGYRKITCKRTHGTIQVYAADERTGDGVIPTLALVEELHRHKDLRLYRTWRGKLQKRGGQMLAISTAGEPGGEYEDAKAHAIHSLPGVRNGAHRRLRGSNFVMHQYALREDENWKDLDLVKSANPLKAISREALEDKFVESPSFREEHWRRYVCGIATASENPWIHAEEWDACRGEVRVDEADGVFVGVDIGQVKDSSAVVEVGWIDEKLHVRSWVRAPRPGSPVTIAEVEAKVFGIANEGRMLDLAYDQNRFNHSGEELEARGLPAFVFPQSPQRMSNASSVLYDLVREKRIVHDGDRVLRSHVLAAVAKPTEFGWRLDKRRSRQHIDATVAMAMAVARAWEQQPSGPLVAVY